MKKLQMQFKTAGQSTSTVTVDDVMDGLTEADVRPIMDTIITENVFNSTRGDYVQIKSAKVTTITEEVLI